MIRLRHYALSVLAGCIVLFIPLLRDLHIESAILASVAGCILACYLAARADRSTDLQMVAALVTVVYTAGLPLLIHAIITGCYSFHGLGFWIFYPSLSILFVYSITRFFRLTGFRNPLLWGAAVFVWAGIVVFLIEFFTLPQVFFHNHVWGGWPGPIYDEDVRLGSSVLYFRSITLSWAVLFWVFPDVRSNRIALFLAVAMSLNLMLSYTRLAENGVISPGEWIQMQLGGHLQTGNFDIYYDPGAYPEHELRMIAAWHEFHLAELTDTLGVTYPYHENRIKSYLYAHPWQKQKLTGAKFTSYVPVWQKTDQLHIAKSALEHSLRHELVHVVAKQFGNRLFNASWSIGLVEGVAVALDERTSGVATTDQLVASTLPWPGEKEMISAFSITGFYGGRGSVNYTTAGSFVGYLLSEYPVEYLKDAYRTGNISRCYTLPMAELVDGWHRYLETIEYDDVQREAAAVLFSVPSIFEKPCPHLVTDAYRHFDDYRLNLATGDTASAISSLEDAIALQPDNDRLRMSWSYLNLLTGNYEQVYEFDVSAYLNYAPLQMQQIDALILKGHFAEADRLLATVREDTSASGRGMINGVGQREDSPGWKNWLQVIYRNYAIDAEEALEYGNEAVLMYFRQLLAGGHYSRILRERDVSEKMEYHPAFADVFTDLGIFFAAADLAVASASMFARIEPGSLNEIQNNRVTMGRRFAERLAIQGTAGVNDF
jgi:hypothetical protein